MLRVVVREGFSADLARSLYEDMAKVVAHMDELKPGGQFDRQQHFAH